MNTAASPGALREQLEWHTGRALTVDASAIAMKHMGREITNTPMLGALAAAKRLFEVGQLAQQIKQEFGEKTVQANIAAMNEAADRLEEG